MFILDKSSNLYQCTICNSTYNHPGNFKQHMLKHEREARNRLERGSEANHLNSVLQSAFGMLYLYRMLHGVDTSLNFVLTCEF